MDGNPDLSEPLRSVRQLYHGRALLSRSLADRLPGARGFCSRAHRDVADQEAPKALVSSPSHPYAQGQKLTRLGAKRVRSESAGLNAWRPRGPHQLGDRDLPRSRRTIPLDFGGGSMDAKDFHREREIPPWCPALSHACPSSNTMLIGLVPVSS